jgi:hypothetical protein
MIAWVVAREFAKNSRVFAAFALTENTLPQFSSLVDRVRRTTLAFEVLISPSTKETKP